MAFKTPILFLTFVRLDTTIKVFERIKAQQPLQLFIASDGPRANRPDDKQKIEEIKNYISKEIDWECEVKTLYRAQNLGCGRAVSGAITWFFENVEQGIILEDDCIPEAEFFSFCEDLLERYKTDRRIWEISGTNLQRGIKRGDGSYYISNYGGIWGWATWARAWEKYDYNMSSYETFVNKRQISQIFGKQQQSFWLKTLKKAKAIDTWDYQWQFARWSHNGLSVVPNVNLIKNIGFNADATHTLSEPSWYELAIGVKKTLGKVKHPLNIEVDTLADDFLFENYYKQAPLLSRWYQFLKRQLNKLKIVKNDRQVN